MQARRRFSLTLLFVVMASQSLGAQVVRGRIIESTTSAPVAGAVVSLLPADRDSVIVSRLSTEAGDYALRAASAGRYRLAVKRIGVRRFVSMPFDLGAGETRAQDVPIDAFTTSLPEVTVSGLCVSRQRDLSRVASLWDEVRTALAATEISLRDQLIEANLSRYAAELDPATLDVLFDWRMETQVGVRPFTSLSGDSLSAVGYWRTLAEDSVEYLAPDANALASNAFLLDHCFGLAPQVQDRKDLVGLVFEPAPNRERADIAGTIWLDATRFELRVVEFRYTKLPRIPYANRVGGEVHFTRLTSGAWIVDHWLLRMPQLVRAPDGFARRRLREAGGSAAASSAHAASGLAGVTGVVRDSSGRPVVGAVVRVIGSQRQVTTGADGSYALDSIPSGNKAVVVRMSGYDSLASIAAAHRVELRPGETAQLDLRADNTLDLRRQYCPPVGRVQTTRRRYGRGVIRLVVLDSVTAEPLRGVPVRVTWTGVHDGTNASGRERFQQDVPDTRGAVTFCDLPTDIIVWISVLDPDGAQHRVLTAQLMNNAVFGRMIRTSDAARTDGQPHAFVPKATRPRR